FVDAGQVWAEPDSVDLGDIVATPGFGFRYQSPIGPLRVDFAFNALGPQQLRVVTTTVRQCDLGDDGCQRTWFREPRDILENGDDVVELEQRVAYSGGRREIDSIADFLSRFQIHFSIGQPF
ncbi:MAG: BamA/TamA family outer membrane protein, partial [Longimicrobiales bacterium]|nr:BamA/TamA family outer membrane protein [Longimicrobiales bacterium]